MAISVAVALVLAVLAGGLALTGFAGTLASMTGRTAERGYGGYQPESEPAGEERPGNAAAGPMPTTSDRLAPTRPGTAAPTPANTARQPQPVVWLGDNPINRDGLGLPDVACTLPPFSQDPAGQDRFYQAGLSCLDAAWTPVLKAAGLPVRPVSVETMTGPISTPCGNQPAQRPAFYCPENSSIYMTARFYAERFGAHPGNYLAVLAHEYGHHVQDVAGIFEAYWDARYEAGTNSAAGLELARRLELQANCYGGMFITSLAGHGSVDRATTDEMVFALGNGGDDARPGGVRDHGSIASNGRWASNGRQHNLTWQCNTWMAPADSVA